MIRIKCKNCGRKFNVAEINASKKGKCPSCKNVLIVPKLKSSSYASKQGVSEDKQKGLKYSAYDLSLLDVPKTGETHEQPVDKSDRASEQTEKNAKNSDGHKGSFTARKHPWLIDIFLYPTSASGMIHIAVFVFVPLFASFLFGLLASFLSPFLLWGTGYIMRYLTAPFYVVFYSYVLYYIAHCVFESSKGHRRASDISISGGFDIGELISEVILLLGCFAICFWPAAIYYAFTYKTDLRFWLLSGCGTFFLPMSFLRGVMFDSFDALNPILITWSIIRTFLPYCGLVLFFLAVGGFIAAVLPRLPLWGFLTQGIKIYLVFVLAHRLGWFYWWNKDKLNWGI
ncbi:MAG: hypothetical protein MUP16_10755 [Sedimentisphaerales bacterium]|nr:hypothetical protein [Sedimentisphaerales bacterium]